MKNKFWLYLFLLLLAGFCLIFFRLGQVPSGLAWDEAAIAYDGFSIWHTYRDQWLTKLPISFKSFGDYKAPLAIYLNGLFTYLFDVSSWSIRLPFALNGFLAIGSFIWLTFVWLRWSGLGKRATHLMLSLVGGTLILTSPWFFHFSRAGFESGIALNLTILAVAGLFQSQVSQKKYRSLFFQFFSMTCFALTVYTYHSSKLVTPLLLITWLIIVRRDLWKKKIKTLAYLFWFALLLLPFLKDAVFAQGLTRAQVNVLALYGWWEGGVKLIANYLLHFSPSFLFLGQTTTLRHGDGRFGVLLFSTLILFGLGIVANYRQIGRKHNQALIFALAWLLIGLLPAALGEDVPHSNRAFQALPGFLLFAVLGLNYLLQLKQKIWLALIIFLHTSLSVAYFHHYFTRYAQQSGDAFQEGYQTAFALSEEYIRGQKFPVVSKVYFSNQYGQAYIYALLYKRVTPYEFHNGVLSMYEFKDQINVGDFQRQNALLVATGKDTDLLPERADHVIYGKDGDVRFKLYKTE